MSRFFYVVLMLNLLLPSLSSAENFEDEFEYFNPILLKAGESFRVGSGDVGMLVKCEAAPAPVPQPIPQPVPVPQGLRVTSFRKSDRQSDVRSNYTRYIIEGTVEGDFDRLVLVLQGNENHTDIPVDRLGRFSTEMILATRFHTHAYIQVLSRGKVVAQSEKFYIFSLR